MFTSAGTRLEMGKIQSPLLGYNNNVRHKNRVFHIQTEDSGVKHPHVITHLFMDGGRILKSVKTSYAEHVGADGLQDTVRAMMKEQHKAMFIALRDGQFDHMFEPGEGSVAKKVSVPVPDAPPASDPLAAPASAPLSSPLSAPQPPRPFGQPPQRTPTLLGTQTIPAPPPSDALVMRAPEATIPDDVPVTTRESARPYVDLEKRSLIADDLPPPPQGLFQTKKSDTGRYGKVPAEGAPVPREEPSEQRKAPTTEAAPPPPQALEGRYAPARPAAIFGQAKPRQSSIFGEDLISDKSLDEVILSYLAEDLEVEKKE